MVESTARDFISVAATVGSRGVEVGGNMFEMMRTVTFQNYSSLSAFILLVWDYAVTLGDEVPLIWSQPASPTKFAFFLSRYFGLASQLTNYIITVTRFSNLPVTETACKWWSAFEAVTFWVLFISSDLVLMMRVYKSYNQSNRVGLGLILLHVAETLIVIICSWRIIDSVKFNPICNSIVVPRDVIAIVATIVISQSIIWTLTFIKRDVKRGKKRITLAAILGDGKWPWLIILCMLMIIVPEAFAHQFMLPHVIFSWPSTMLSIGTCRLLLNMARLRKSQISGLPKRSEPISPVPIPDPHGQQQRQQQQQQQQVSQNNAEAQTLESVPTIRSDIQSSPRVDVSSHGNNTTTSYVSSSLGPSLYPTMLGDSTRSRESVTTSTSMTSRPEAGTLSFDGGGDRSVNIEIGSLHVTTTSSMNSEEMRRFWNDL